MKRGLVAAAQLAITAGIYLWLFRGFDWTTFLTMFARLPLWFYLVSLAVVLGGNAVYAWRWRLLLVSAGREISTARALEQYFIGIFVNNFLPSTVGGDAAKVYYLGREHGYRTIFASVVLDRVLGVGILSAFGAVALWASGMTGGPVLAARAALGGIALVAAVVLAFVAAGTGGLSRRLRAFGPRAAVAADHLQGFRLDMAAPARSPLMLLLSATSVLAYFVPLTAVYGMFLSLQTVGEPSFVALFAVVTATATLSNVPLTINGLGLREQLHVILFRPLGVPKEVAVAISLLLFGHIFVAGLIGGVLWLWLPAAPASGNPST